eukprot:SAG31_NODE_2181_length_6246_cov_12.867252_3_plen_562_part_00
MPPQIGPTDEELLLEDIEAAASVPKHLECVDYVRPPLVLPPHRQRQLVMAPPIDEWYEAQIFDAMPGTVVHGKIDGQVDALQMEWEKQQETVDKHRAVAHILDVCASRTFAIIGRLRKAEAAYDEERWGTEGSRLFYRVLERQQLRSGPFPRDKKLKGKWLESGEVIEVLEERASGEGLAVRIAHPDPQFVIDYEYDSHERDGNAGQSKTKGKAVGKGNAKARAITKVQNKAELQASSAVSEPPAVPNARRSGWMDTVVKGKRLLTRSWRDGSPLQYAALSKASRVRVGPDPTSREVRALGKLERFEVLEERPPMAELKAAKSREFRLKEPRAVKCLLPDGSTGWVPTMSLQKKCTVGRVWAGHSVEPPRGTVEPIHGGKVKRAASKGVMAGKKGGGKKKRSTKATKAKSQKADVEGADSASDVNTRTRRTKAKSAAKTKKKKKVWGELSSESEEEPHYSDDSHSSDDEDDDLIVVRECIKDLLSSVEVADVLDNLVIAIETKALMARKKASFRAKRGRKKTKKAVRKGVLLQRATRKDTGSETLRSPSSDAAAGIEAAGG